MTSTEERLLRTYLEAHGDIYGQDDDAGFGVSYAGRATPEGAVKYKHVPELAQVWQDRYVAGLPPGLQCRLHEPAGCLGRWAVPLPDVHLEDCPGPGAGQRACAGVTPGSGGHEDSLPRRAGWPADRRPSTQETHGLDDGHPAFQGATEGQVARCALRWESLSDRPAVGRRPADRPAPRMRVGSGSTSSSLYISIRA